MAPKYLYKYKPIPSADNSEEQDRFEDIILRNKLFFASPKNFNDPFDCQIVPNIPNDKKQIFKSYVELLKSSKKKYSESLKLRSEHKNILNKLPNPKQHFENEIKALLKEYMRVFCLSEDGASVPMYAHYANDHRGCCLKFQADKGFFSAARKVHYNSDYPSVDYLGSTAEERSKVLLTKAKCWEYEKEWRLIKEVSYIETDRHYDFSEHLLVGIILGYRVSEKRKCYIQNLTKQRKSSLTLYQVEPHESKYEMEIIELSNESVS